MLSGEEKPKEVQGMKHTKSDWFFWISIPVLFLTAMILMWYKFLTQ